MFLQFWNVYLMNRLSVDSVGQSHTQKNKCWIYVYSFMHIQTKSLWYSVLFRSRQTHTQTNTHTDSGHLWHIVSLVHHGAHCGLVVHIAAWWCTSTPYTIVVVQCSLSKPIIPHMPRYIYDLFTFLREQCIFHLFCRGQYCTRGRH